MGRAAGVGLFMAVGIGLMYGWFAVSAGFRIPYLHLLVAWLIGLGVSHAAGEQGDQQGVMAGAFTLLSIGIGIGIMSLNQVYVSWFTGVITLIAIYIAYRTASGGD